MGPLLDRLRARFPHAAPHGAGARLVLALVHHGRPVRVGLRLRLLAAGERSALAVQAVVGRSPETPLPGLARDGDDLVRRSLLWEPASAEALADHLVRIAGEVAAARAALDAKAVIGELFGAYSD